MSDSENMLQSTLRLVECLAGVGYWRYDIRTGQVSWSDEVYRIHGLAPGGLEPSYDRVVELYHPDDQPVLRAHVAAAVTTGTGYNFKLRVIRADNQQERVVRAIADTRTDEDGRTLELFGVFQDITDIEAFIARLEDSESRYRLLADASHDIILKIDADLNIAYVSPAVERYGHRVSDLVGRPASSILYPDDAAKVRGALSTLASGRTARPDRDRTFRFLAVDGTQVWMEASPSPVFNDDGGFSAVLSSLRDVTDRRVAQIALEESEARYRLLAEHMQDIVVRAGPGGIISYASPSTRMLGVEPHEAIGRSTLDFVSAEDREVAKAALDQLFTGDEPDQAQKREYRVLRRDGRELWIEGRPSIVRDADGRPVEFVTTFRDVTERYLLTRRLEMANASAQAALRQKAEFIANISHDFKTPLAAIVGFARDLPEIDPAGAALLAPRIVEQAEELLLLVDDLLDRAALDAGRLVPRSSAFAIADMVRSAIDLVRRPAREKGLELTATVDVDLPRTVVGDKSRIRRVLLNIVSNAVKFSEGGTVHVAISRGEASDVRFAVRDEGPGLPAATANGLFERFSMSGSSGASGGHGLGLAICRELVEELGGRIGYAARAGRKGVTFWFDIPLPGVGEDAERELEQPAKERFNILVVDDSHAFQQIISGMLRALGHSVTCAGSAEQGLALAGASAFDIFYIDLNLADQSGLDLIASLRLAGIGKPIVLVSADDSGLLDRERTVLPDAFLSKPLDLADMIASLKLAGRQG